MRDLTEPERCNLIDEFFAEASGDLVGLWEIAKEVEELVGTGDVAREQSLSIVTALLAKGLVAGDPPYRSGGFKVWSDQSPNRVVERIRSEWLGLGHTPNIPDIAWFGLPD